jgi:hypothetical protein
MPNSSTTINLPPNVSQTLTAFSGVYGVDANVTMGVAQAGSGGNQNMVSSTGAIGIMQMEPSTFYGLQAPAGQVFLTSGMTHFTDINDPNQNMEAGTYYLSQQHQTFGNYPTALAAYNAGPTSVNNAGGIPSFTQGFVRQVSMLAQNAGSTSSDLKTQSVATQSNSTGTSTSAASTQAQPVGDQPQSIEPVVTSLQIGTAQDPQGLDATPWFKDDTLVIGNRRIRNSVQPVSFRIYLSQQTGELLHNPTDNKPIVLQLNTSLQQFELQSKHIYNRQPSRTGQHVTFWGMQPDLVTGSGTTGVFMNQFGLTDWFSVANVPEEVIEQVTRAFTTGHPITPQGYKDANLANQQNFMRVAAQDAFMEFMKMFQMNGNVWFYNPNYASYQTGQQQSTPTGWSPQTGLSALQQNARNNDVFSRGWVEMTFKNNTFLGYFKSLSWTQDAEKPFQWNFNFSFQVERTFTSLYFPTGINFTPVETQSSIITGGIQ